MVSNYSNFLCSTSSDLTAYHRSSKKISVYAKFQLLFQISLSTCNLPMIGQLRCWESFDVPEKVNYQVKIIEMKSKS